MSPNGVLDVSRPNTLAGEGRSPKPEAEGDGERRPGWGETAIQLHPTPPAFAVAALGSTGDPPPLARSASGEGGVQATWLNEIE
jgi:hypothetical protein